MDTALYRSASMFPVASDRVTMPAARQHVDAVALQQTVQSAIARLERTEEPLIVVWTENGLVFKRASGKRAATELRRETCLGVYTDDTSFGELMSDLLYVLEHKGRKAC